MLKRWFTVILAAIFVASDLLAVAAVAEASGTWGNQKCGVAVQSYPVSTGTITGEVCAQWWLTTDPVYQWINWAETWAPQSYAIQTYVAGYDRCVNTDPWTYEMSRSNIDYNTNYGTSNGWVQGNYISSCGSNHSYASYYSGEIMATSSSSWEGTGAWFYY